MEQLEVKQKMIAESIKVDVSKLTNKVMSTKLKELEIDGTGNKEALTNRLFAALKLELPKGDQKPPETKPPVPTKGMLKSAGFYAKWKAGRTNVQNQESPIFDWQNAIWEKTVSMSHSHARLLNAQTETSGIKYVQVEKKSDKE
ncbi:hypothetical protein KAR91_38995 [Candidatus Pacearchaeota archaeon]|nr:hypothetical protein [Candidatus Pacearchaeota archaeon]